MHRHGVDIWNCIAVEGAAALMMDGNSMGTNWKGRYSVSMLKAFARGRLCEVDSLPDTVKFVMLMARHMHEQYHGRYYAKAQNLGRVLTRAYDDMFREVDALLLPTLPMKAIPLPTALELTPAQVVASALGDEGAQRRDPPAGDVRLDADLAGDRGRPACPHRPHGRHRGCACQCRRSPLLTI